MDPAGGRGWKGLARVAASIVANPTWPHSMRWAARTCGMDRLEFRFHWEALVGCGFHEFVERVRVDRALVLFATTDLEIGEIARRVGCGDAQDLRWGLRDTLGERHRGAVRALRFPG